MNLNELTIKEAHQGLKKKDFSSVELTKACLAQINKLNKKVNAFITITEDEALKQAKKANKRIKEGKQIDILEGIPLAIKDNILIEGVRITAGSKMLENYVAPYDAAVIKKLKEKGAVLLGKTNMDEFAMGSSTETSYFGPTRNPLDLKRVPGGSSGGSAAAVASQMCLGALGSDTGGSVRQPASFCGIVGLKPTYGRLSRYGLISLASSLDHIGVLGKTTEDCRIIFEAIRGKDELDSTSAELNSKSEILNSKQIQNPKSKIQNLKIGVSKECFAEGLDKEVKKVIKKAIDRLKKSGIEIVDISLPHIEYALACYYILMPAEASSNLARYDGIRYGYSNAQSPKPKAQSLLDEYLETRGEGFGKEVKRRIILGTFTLSAGYYEAYYNQAQKVRALIKKDFDQAFSAPSPRRAQQGGSQPKADGPRAHTSGGKKVDLIITPTTPNIAFKIGEKDDPLTMYLSDIFTVPINLAGLPAISIPCGKVEKMPVGLQIIGRQFDEERIFQAAQALEENIKLI